MYIHHVVCLEISDQNILKSDQNIFYQLHGSAKKYTVYEGCHGAWKQNKIA